MRVSSNTGIGTRHVSNGFVAPGEELPEDSIKSELDALTKQTYELPKITRGRYILEEDDLPKELKQQLHGRAFVIDREILTVTGANDAVTYYIAGDKGQGLIIPARSISIDAESYDILYRFTDDGERWTNWITLPKGMTDSSSPLEKNRYAEIQAYSTTSGGIISIRATR